MRYGDRPSRSASFESHAELSFAASGLSMGLDGGSRMARLRVLAVAATVVCTAPAAAEPAASSTTNAISSLSRVGGHIPVQMDRRGFSFPVVGYAEPNGLFQQRRGIIAGKEIARGTVLGVGIFQTAPKLRGYVGDIPPNMAPKRSKRAAIGLSMKF
jgi:hypothetical protein